MVCNWFGHILSLARPARGESSIAHRAPPLHPPSLESFVITSWLHWAIGRAPPGSKGQAFKRELLHWHNKRWHFIWHLTTTSPSPSPLTNIQPPSCIPTAPRGALDLCECVQAGWCILVQSFFACFYSSNRIHWIFFFFTEKPLIFWPNFNHNLNIPIEINSNMYLWFQVSYLYLVFSIHSAMPALVSLHPCQVYLEWIDCRCYLGFRQRPEASVCVCLCERARETVSERVNDWHQTRVLHSGGSVGATQPVWQVIISVSCSGMTATSSETKHTTHTNSFPWVTEECLSKPIDWAINWGPTGNPLQSICPLLHGSRNATMAVALN